MIKYIFITQTLYFFLFQICDGATEWISITSDGFEGPGSTKYGNWKRGGSDAAVVGNNSHSGNRAARIKNGTTPQKATLFHKNNHDVTLFDTLRINFWYKSKSFEAQHNDKFYFEYSSNGGNTWNSVETWTIGEDFENNVYKEESVILDRSIFEFTEKARLRFRCSGNQGNDRIYLDDIEFEGSINAAPDPIQEPTLSPTSAPSKSSPTTPTDSPTTGCKTFTFDLTTDDFGYEVTFTLVDAPSGMIRLGGGEYDSSSSFQEVSCLTNGRYIFTISDSNGDGICCNEGNGSYSISLDDNLLKSGGAFAYEEQTVFDVGPPGPTSAPTQAPTCGSAGASCLLGDECCSGRCKSYVCWENSSTSGPTQPPSTSCKSAGNMCLTSDQCCSGHCIAFKCSNPPTTPPLTSPTTTVSPTSSPSSFPSPGNPPPTVSQTSSPTTLILSPTSSPIGSPSSFPSSGNPPPTVSPTSSPTTLTLSPTSSSTKGSPSSFPSSGNPPSTVSPTSSPTTLTLSPTSSSTKGFPSSFPSSGNHPSTVSPTSSPTTLTLSPTSSSTKGSPSSFPSSGNHPPTATAPPSTGCKIFTFDLITDDFGYEAAFTLTVASSGILRLGGGGYGSSSAYQEIACLTNGRYIFTISDSHGDGICCNEGNGSYSISLDDNLLKSGGAFGYEEQTVFDVGPPGPTSAPTPVPTCRSAGVSCLLGDECCSGRCKTDVCASVSS